ncbi:MAG: TRAP transporter substrate-binding protein [Spirochaetales bacterium]|jgi:tripartite ATP-independent transporter DctP family solute receptor|nr:TRAP transporter substrate-binding protein [Spirochaetales bacterium]
MKKIFVILLVLAVFAAMPLAAGGGQDTSASAGAKVRTYRLADNQPDGYPTVLGDQKLADVVKEKTNGGIVIEVYNNSVLGTEKETIEQTQIGDIQFIRVGTNPLSSINPIGNALSMPFLFRDRDHMFKVLDGPIGEEIMNAYKSQNLLGLCWFDAGFRNFYNTKRSIKTPADMAGLKIRVQESSLMMDMIRNLGASPTPMAYGEVYPGMQNGIIDGAENNWPSYITAAHYEVAKYFTTDAHMCSPEMVLINTGVWDSFSDAEKKIVKDAAAEGAKVERSEWLKAEQKYEQVAKDSGSIITNLTPEQHKLFEEAEAPLYAKPEYASLLPIIQRIRDTK